MTSSGRSDRRSAARSGATARSRRGGRKPAARVWAGLFGAGLLLACGGEQGAALQGAEQPLRLRLVREAADVEAAAAGGCIRGRLSVVRGFDPAAVARGVWIADTLERAPALAAGVHAGVAGVDPNAGWYIELPEVRAVLRAHPDGLPQDAEGAILLGRRSASPAAAGPCDPAAERLDQGAALLRRLRDVYASPSDERPVEVSVEP